MKNTTLAESAGICGVRFLNAMAQNRGRLPDFAKEEIDACSRAIAQDITWDDWRGWADGSAEVDADDLLALGFRPWNDDGSKRLWLIPVWLAPFVPEGFPVASISGDQTSWTSAYIDGDTRFGVLAFGIVVPRPSEGGVE